MDEAVINILDDPKALSMTLKKQYDDVQHKNEMLRAEEKEQIKLNKAAGLETGEDTHQQSISTSGQGYTLEPDELSVEESKQEL